MSTISEVIYLQQETPIDELIVCGSLKLNVNKWCLLFACQLCDEEIDTFADILRHYLIVHMCWNEERTHKLYSNHVGDYCIREDVRDEHMAKDAAQTLKEEEIEFCESFSNTSVGILDENSQIVEVEFSQAAEIKLAKNSQVDYVHQMQCNELLPQANKNKFNCAQCGKACNKSLHQSMYCNRCYGASRPFKCDICGSSFTRTGSLNYHRRQQHPNVATNDEMEIKTEVNTEAQQGSNGSNECVKKKCKFNCARCGKICNNSRNQTTCCSKCYGSTKPYKCDICSKSFTRVNTMNRHRRMHQNVLTAENLLNCDVKTEQHVIETKEERMSQAEAITNTAKSNRKPGKWVRFNCEQCGKLCVKTAEQTKFCHKCNRVNKPYSCNICDANFAEKSNLRSHLKRHSGVKPNLCAICGKTFTLNTDLKRHLKQTHNKERPFACEECGKRFPTQNRLTLHLRRHRNERPFKCNECGKSFYEKTNLNTHMQTHSLEKPFACHICELKFPVKVYLTEHLKIHSKFKAYKCELCSEAFVQIAGLCSHRKRHHPNYKKGNATCAQSES